MLLGVAERVAVLGMVRDHEVGVDRPVAMHVRVLGAGVLHGLDQGSKPAGRGEPELTTTASIATSMKPVPRTSQRCQCGNHQAVSSFDGTIERYASPILAIAKAG